MRERTGDCDQVDADGNITVIEDADDQTNDPEAAYAFTGHVTFVDGGPDDETHTFAGFAVVQVSDTSLFTGTGQPAIDASGNLTFTTASDAHGFADVTVRATDSGSGTDPNENTTDRTFRITVTPVSVSPSRIARGMGAAPRSLGSRLAWPLIE